jgi:hypothetical protein
VSALTHARGDFDPVGLIQILSDARTVGGRGAVFAIAKRDVRMYDAAATMERCRVAHHNAQAEAMHGKR